MPGGDGGKSFVSSLARNRNRRLMKIGKTSPHEWQWAGGPESEPAPKALHDNVEADRNGSAFQMFSLPPASIILKLKFL